MRFGDFSFLPAKIYKNRTMSHISATIYLYKGSMGRGVKYPSVRPASTKRGIVPDSIISAFFPPDEKDFLLESRPGKIIDLAIVRPAAPQTKIQNNSGTP